MPTTARELAELLERVDQEGRRDLLAQAVAAELAKHKPAEPARVKPAVVRAKMSAAAKSEFIRKHGLAKYNLLPWAEPEE